MPCEAGAGQLRVDAPSIVLAGHSGRCGRWSVRPEGDVVDAEGMTGRAVTDPPPTAATDSDGGDRRRGVDAEPLAVALQVVGAGVLVVLSLPMPQGSLSQPGAGFWPMCLGVALAVLALVSGAQWLMRSRTAEPDRVRLGEMLIPGAAILSLVAYLVALGEVGFTLPSIVLILGWLRFFGKETWRLSLLLAVLGALVLAVLFDRVLGVPLPDDLLLSWMLR